MTFLSSIVIAKLSLITSITFEKVQLKEIDELSQVLRKALDGRVGVKKIRFWELEVGEEVEAIEELVEAVNHIWGGVEELELVNVKDTVWYWIISYLDVTKLRRIRLEGVTLTFLEQFNRIMKTAKSLEVMEFIDWKVKKKI
jgi:hypothetical protein